MARSAVLVVTTVVAVCLSSDAASAQSRPSRPSRGLFGGGGGGGTSQSLTATFNTAGGHDSGTTTGGGSGVDGEVMAPSASTSTFGSWAGALSYALAHSRVDVTAMVSASSRLVSAANVHFPVSRQSGVQLRWRVFKHTDFSAQGGSSRTTLSALSLFPGLPTDTINSAVYENFALDPASLVYTSNQTGLRLSQMLSQRTTVVAGYSYLQAGFSSLGRARTVQAGNLDVSHRLTRNLSLRLGYEESVADYVDSADTPKKYRNDNINASVDYSGALTLARRTTLTMRTGSSIVSDRSIRRLAVTGNAVLQHEIGRSWDSSLGYDRAVGFVETLREPAFTDSLSGALSGLLSRRFQVQSSAGVATGAVGLRAVQGRRYWAYHAGVSLAVALSRYFNLRTDYTYYSYSSKSSDLQFFGREHSSGSSVSGGFDVYAPLFVRGARRSDATR